MRPGGAIRIDTRGPDGAAPYLAGMEAGWTQSLERLTEYLAKA